MASTIKTRNLKLTHFVESDTPSWLTDYNNDMQKIDDAVMDAQEKIDNAVIDLQEKVNNNKAELMEQFKLQNVLVESKAGVIVQDKEFTYSAASKRVEFSFFINKEMLVTDKYYELFSIASEFAPKRTRYIRASTGSAAGAVIKIEPSGILYACSKEACGAILGSGGYTLQK